MLMVKYKIREFHVLNSNRSLITLEKEMVEERTVRNFVSESRLLS